MKPELCLNRALRRADIRTKNHGIELGNHLSGSKLTEIATFETGWALRMLTSELGKIGTALDLSFEIVAKLFCVYENMACARCGHLLLFLSFVLPVLYELTLFLCGPDFSPGS